MGDKGLSATFIHDARKLVAELETKFKRYPAPVLQKTLYLGDIGAIYAYYSNDIKQITIVTSRPTATIEEAEDRLLYDSAFPTYLSGAVTNPRLIPQKVKFEGETIELPAVTTYIPTALCATEYELPFALQTSTKLGVRLLTALFGEFYAETQEVNSFSQHGFLKPGLYTGRMRRLVQVMLGYGTQSNDPEEIGYQIPYDYKFHTCHGLYRASDNVDWVIHIVAGRGIFASPLVLVEDPPVPELGDYLYDIYKEFNGLPLGGGPPIGLPTEDMSRYITAGIVLQIATAEQIGPIFDLNLPPSFLIGWAFNEKGNRASNVVWNYDPDGIQHTYLYTMDIQIDAITSLNDTDVFKAAEVIAAGSLGTPFSDKCLRLSASQIDSVYQIRAAGADAIKAMLDGMVAPPLAPSSYAHSVERDGRVFINSSTLFAKINFKYPQVSNQGIGMFSWDAATFQAGQRPKENLLNAPLYVFYVKDEIKYISFVNDLRSQDDAGPRVTGETPECPYVDSWTIETELGSNTIPQTIITTEFDDRAEGSTFFSRYTFTGSRIGPLPYYLQDDLQDPRYGSAFRVWAFKIRYDYAIEKDKAAGNVALAPWGDREGYIYMNMSYIGSGGTAEGITFAYLIDPYAYPYERQFPAGRFPESREPCIIGDGDNKRTVLRELYNPDYPCSYLANGGGYLSTCQKLDENRLEVPLFPFEAGTHTYNEEYNIQVYIVSSATGGQPVQPNVVYTGGDWDRWSNLSPDPLTGHVQTFIATVSGFDEGANMAYMQGPDDFTEYKQGSFCTFWEAISFGSCFIGDV